MEKAKVKSGEKQPVGVYLKPNMIDDLRNSIAEFSELFNLKLTLDFSVNAAISQYTKLLLSAIDNYNMGILNTGSEPGFEILKHERIGNKDGLTIVFRINNKTQENFINAIGGFNQISGINLTKSCAIRSALLIYLRKLHKYSEMIKKGKNPKEEKVIQDIGS